MPTPLLPTLAQTLVILVPCYTVAYTTEKMVYVVPTLAATLVIGRALVMNTDSDSANADFEDGDGGQGDTYQDT